MKFQKRRTDCYFGLHFDFHAIDGVAHIGAFTDAKKFGEYLDAVKPDFVQFDTKGHPGYASFMSEYGTVAPGLTVDHLKIIREETKKRGILLFAHYSGHIDKRAITDHPDWTTIRKNGELDEWSVNASDSPYYETIMLPQLKELAGKYGFDGAWIDGDCGVGRMDYSEKTMEEFRAETGYNEIDEDPASPSHVAFTKMQRRKLVKYVQRYVKDIKKEYPDFELASCWANSIVMAENSLDCLDYNSVDLWDASFGSTNARCFSGLGKPWDLMSWGHAGQLSAANGVGRPLGQRSTERLERDGAIAVSLGGTYQVYNMMTQFGEVRMTEMESMKRLAQFLRARQPFCQKAKPLKNVAVWYSAEENIRLEGEIPFVLKPYVFYAERLVADGGRPVDIVYDDVILSDRIYEHPVLIIPGIHHILPEYRDALLKYMEQGGKVIAIGAPACKAFIENAVIEEHNVYFENDIYMQGVSSNHVAVFPQDMEPLVGCYIDDMKTDAPRIHAAAWKRSGKGAIYCIGWDIVSDYGTTWSFISRSFIRSVLDQADPRPEAYLENGISCVQIIPSAKNGEKMVNLVNMTDSQDLRYPMRDVGKWPTNDGPIPPAVDLTIAVKYDNAPAKLWFEPEHRELTFTYDGEYAHVLVPRLDIHGIIVATFME